MKLKEMNIILVRKIKHYSKNIFKIMSLLILAAVIILTIISIKRKSVYKVFISGEFVGYVQDKDDFNTKINNEILTPKESNIAFISVTAMPEYQHKFVDKNEETSEDLIYAKLEEQAVPTYRVYAINFEGETKAKVDTFEEAETLVNEIKAEYGNDTDLGINEIYTNNLEEATSIEFAQAKSEVQVTLEEKAQEIKKIESSTYKGVYFAVKPVSGNITSRFGSRSSPGGIGSTNHKGIDIAAPNGTTIVAAADGTVTYSGWMGGYGNLIILKHANGVETYYGHCSKLYVSVGTKVSAGTKIAAVGSTGNSTGNHLHFEIRGNGSQVNPQKYVYK